MSRTPKAAPIPASHRVASWVLMGVALVAILQLHLLPALLAGLLVFSLVHLLAGALQIPYLTSRHAKILLVALLAVVVVALLVLIGFGIGLFLRRGPDNLAMLLCASGHRSGYADSHQDVHTWPLVG